MSGNERFLSGSPRAFFRLEELHDQRNANYFLHWKYDRLVWTRYLTIGGIPGSLSAIN
jgi:hypothetical protein